MDLGLSRATNLRNDPALAAQVLEAVIAFSNAHLMMKLKNLLALVACDTDSTEWMYPEEKSDVADLRQTDGQHELFNELERTVRRRVSDMLKKNAGGTGKGESMLSGALGRALCYIHRLEQEDRRINARLLVVTANGQSVSQYMSFMNVFFTAQKQVSSLALQINRALGSQLNFVWRLAFLILTRVRDFIELFDLATDAIWF